MRFLLSISGLLLASGCFYVSSDDLADRLEANVPDRDGDGTPDDEDCEPDDPAVHPGADEICLDGLDNDCDGGAGSCRMEGDVALADASARLLGDADVGAVGWSFLGEDAVGPTGQSVLIAGLPAADASGIDAYGRKAGRVLLYTGPISGTLSADGGAFAELAGDQDGLMLGYALAAVGDIDSNGHPDFAIGVPGDDRGAVLGGSVGVVTGPVSSDSVQYFGDLDLVGAGEVEGGFFGGALAGGGDVDGNGWADLVVGEPSVGVLSRSDGFREPTTFLHGRVLLYDSSEGLGMFDDPVATLEGSEDTWLAGAAVALLPDVDGDGRDEVAAGAYADSTQATFGGAAFVFAGPVEGSFDLELADVVVRGEVENEVLGYSIGGAGDLDGDGLQDWFTGSPGVEDATGVLSVFLGLPSGPVSSVDAELHVAGSEVGQATGTQAASVGDFDGDGADDLVVAAVGWAAKDADPTGTACLFYGPLAAGTLTLDAADACIRGEDSSAGLGYRLAGGEDLDGDGWPDLLVASTGQTVEDEVLGAVYLFSGGAM